ncbi:hypothetical protein E2C01_096294 [Portunus trituberculatus]|uniref:Uncharacterized protein n=1 Tax=Portunus trituberculatus TaxID=210409 RepID=A0A5B7K2E2_PORTR|nr:hypothetical protein [Portunus trituberculatus]
MQGAIKAERQGGRETDKQEGRKAGYQGELMLNGWLDISSATPINYHTSQHLQASIRGQPD